MNETWGLVVNEALNYKLPVIVADLVGCTSDLVEEGVNGYTYPLGDIQKLANLMYAISNDLCWIKEAGIRSLAIIEQYSYNTIICKIKGQLK